LACAAGSRGPTPSIVAGSSAAPREVNLIAREYNFIPAEIELIPGETILLHVINGGLVAHEAVIGDASVQEAWDVAEAAFADPPPGPTPRVSVPPGHEGVRVVVASGERVDVAWTVPLDPGATSWFVGCHIPGHLAKGMQVPIRWLHGQMPPVSAIPAS
jgi:uncharacterized cupredoxin-like copper-binding protein